jgi:hypothetical protein
VVSLAKPVILSVFGGCAGAIHDMRIARISGLEGLLASNEEVGIGDKAYIGSPQFIAPFKKPQNGQLTEDQQNFNKLIEQFRHTVERVNARLKVYQSVRQEWRHSIEKHSVVFHVIALLVNLSFKQRPL